MRRVLRSVLIAAAAVALLRFHPGFAQEANVMQTEAINEIARCLAQGLPEDWASAHLIVDLAHPGDATGKVRYLVFRKDAEDKPESFTPCDTDMPPVTLIGLRRLEPTERQGWTTARLVVQRDGT